MGKVVSDEKGRSAAVRATFLTRNGGRNYAIEVDGRLRFVAWKGRGKKKTRRTIDVPISADLAVALANTPTGDLTYLVTENGKAFTINGLGNKMRDWCDVAGLPQCSSHGLRKAAAARRKPK